MPFNIGFTVIRATAGPTRQKAWVDLMDRFGGDVDWTGYEEARTNLWHRQLHIFIHPFYYVEYGIAQLGALQVWANSKKDKAQALREYHHALSLGGSRPLPELFQAAGCRFRFQPRNSQAPGQAGQRGAGRFKLTFRRENW